MDYEKWLRETDRDDSRRYHFIKELASGKRILDVGSGIGGFLITFSFTFVPPCTGNPDFLFMTIKLELFVGQKPYFMDQML